MSNDCAIVIVSCDKYSDLWKPFFDCFFTFWPDCPYTVYLQSNEKKFTQYKSKVVNITTGFDKNWSYSMTRLMEKIPQRYIFTWNEDLFISSKVNSSKFEEYFRLLKKNNGNHIHYRCIPPADSFTKDSRLGIYAPGMPYRSIVMGFWKKAYFEKLLLDGESPWNFEIMGSYRTKFDDGFYCANDTIIEYVHMTEKGKWMNSGVRYCRAHHIAIEENARKMSTGNEIKSTLFKLYFNALLMIHWKYRIKLLDFFRKMFISY